MSLSVAPWNSSMCSTLQVRVVPVRVLITLKLHNTYHLEVPVIAAHVLLEIPVVTLRLLP